jgi:nitrogen fixation protein FixH
VTIGVNAVMVRFATKTFGGVETESSYKAGLVFKQDIEAAAQQESLHWQVDGTVTRMGSGEVALEIKVRDGNGQIVPGWTATAIRHRREPQALCGRGREVPGRVTGEYWIRQGRRLHYQYSKIPPA